MLLAPVLAFGWGVAPAHAHRGEPDHHVPGVVHRHFEPHRAGHTHHPGIEIDQDTDDDVVWLDDAIVQQASYQLPIPIAVSVELVPAQPARPSWFPKTQDDSAPAHGPPRASLSFRGPPPSCLS